MQPPAGTLEKYHIYTYKFYGQQNYADWYTNPRPIFDSLSAGLEEPFDPDTGEMLTDLEYQLGEEAGSLSWEAYDPLLNELSPTDPPADPMATEPAGQTLSYSDADVAVPLPAYGGRYHWVVSGMASVMERDHRLLPIVDQGACVVMHPWARNYEDSSFAGGCAQIAANKEGALDTPVPDGSYFRSSTTDPWAGLLKEGFEDAAIWFYADHGYDDGSNAWVPGSQQTRMYAIGPVLYPGYYWVSGTGGLVNPTQCHLAVFYVCDAGWRFWQVLIPQGVDCVVGVRPGVTLWGRPNNQAVVDTWTEAFWEHLRKGGYVSDALAVAANKVKDKCGQFYNTDCIESFGSLEVIVYARYQ